MVLKPLLFRTMYLDLVTGPDVYGTDLLYRSVLLLQQHASGSHLRRYAKQPLGLCYNGKISNVILFNHVEPSSVWNKWCQDNVWRLEKKPDMGVVGWEQLEQVFTTHERKMRASVLKLGVIIVKLMRLSLVRILYFFNYILKV